MRFSLTCLKKVLQIALFGVWVGFFLNLLHGTNACCFFLGLAQIPSLHVYGWFISIEFQNEMDKCLAWLNL